MRAAVRCVLVMIGIVASVFVGPTGVSTATTNQPNQLSGLTIASVSPKPGEIVDVAHPFVVTFSSRVPDRAAAERALYITSAAPLTGTSVTGKFEWLDHRTVQWVPDQFWPAHSTVTLSVGGRSVCVAAHERAVVRMGARVDIERELMPNPRRRAAATQIAAQVQWRHLGSVLTFDGPACSSVIVGQECLTALCLCAQCAASLRATLGRRRKHTVIAGLDAISGTVWWSLAGHLCPVQCDARTGRANLS